ncbi:hypothetical protein [Streptomyces sp. NBC_01244]|uniref:hypothetical protein n=1 Tax=Streptomyces sp. NBC_01244 TaxID=2903797 RepID=UPI002E10D3EA|nr:hypothetical protein OG247_41605 [Streptomyces sp. NBC_01244]
MPCPTTVRAVLDAVTGMGWSVEVPVGSITYTINDADDMYEWYGSSPGEIGEVPARLDDPGNLPYTVVVNLYHPEAGNGFTTSGGTHHGPTPFGSWGSSERPGSGAF